MPDPGPVKAPDPSSNSVAEMLIAHRSWLRTVIVTRLKGDVATADDILSGIVADILGNPNMLNEVNRVEPWLYRIAINKVTDFLRYRQRSKMLHQRIADDPTRTCEIDALAMSPIDQMLMDEHCQAVRDAFQDLEPIHAELLALKYCHNWSYADLEKHLGMGVNQIAHKLRVARNQLKAALAHAGIVEEALSSQDSKI